MTDPTTPSSPDQPTGDPAATGSAQAEPVAVEPVAAVEPAPSHAIAEPTIAEPAIAEPVTAPPAYAAPVYADPTAVPAAYGAPTQAAADTRPKGIALTAIILAGVGFLINFAGFIPIVGFFAVGLGGLLLLAGFVLGIVALVSKKQGGKGLGIGAIVLAVVGGILGAIAVAVSSWLFLSNVSSTTGAVENPGASASAPVGDYDEEAFLAEVRPQINALMAGIDPSFTAEAVEAGYTDELLVEEIGKPLGQLTAAERDVNRQQFIVSATSDESSPFDEDTAGQFFDIVFDAAQAHLQQ